MIENLPVYVNVTFILTTVLTFALFLVAVKKSSMKKQLKWIALGMIAWLAIQMILSLNLYYLNTVGDTPPKFPVIVLVPTFALIIFLFNSKNGKKFIDSLPLKHLTLISIVRIPVELVLWWLFIHTAVPEIMTFEGQNFDILAGITAPFIVYFGFIKKNLNKRFILAWNVICLLLLVNIVVTALFSFPTVIQKFAFDQPNVGLLYFPFFWLPSFIVPVVFFSHFVSIRRLTLKS